MHTDISTSTHTPLKPSKIFTKTYRKLPKLNERDYQYQLIIRDLDDPKTARAL
jgi:hypothetical protein